MNLKRFNQFVQELSNDPQLNKAVGAIRVYRHFRREWYCEDGSKIEGELLTKRLTFVRYVGYHSCRSKETDAFFPIAELDAVVVGSFSVRPNSNTQHKIKTHVDICVGRSLDAYRARHDHLTELLNRAAFDTLLKEALSQLTSRTAGLASVDTSSNSAFSSVVFLSLDIDFFKRINDSYGHGYGDIVLRSFAIRLESSCSRLAAKPEYMASVTCARLGGEEFAVLLAGDVRPDAEGDVAEFLRGEIEANVLPDESELRVMDDDPRLKGVNLPAIAERRVTASIGLSSQHGAIDPGAVDDVAKRLKRETDQALYRAKRLGRNRYVRFGDIVLRHGQVIEHHADADVVAVDLGHQVGVSMGQEFLVFHPDFTGSKPFIHDDGRSSRKLGEYPKLPSGRLEVLDVQAEISFAYVAEKRGIDSFPVKSILEAVPVGSIDHLIAKDWWQWLDSA